MTEQIYKQPEITEEELEPDKDISFKQAAEYINPTPAGVFTIAMWDAGKGKWVIAENS